jgi:RNA polymerase sigma factor (sigma-70 family)
MAEDSELVVPPSSPRPSGRDRRFTELLVRHADTVNRYLTNRHRPGDALDSEDLLSEVFGIAWRRLDEMPSGSELPWLIVVARNRVLNMRTKQYRRSKRLPAVRPPGSAPAAEDEVIADEALQAALDALPTTEGEALRLSVWEGLTNSEIAETLGLSENAVKIRLSRAKHHILSDMDFEQSETKRTRVKDKE